MPLRGWWTIRPNFSRYSIQGAVKAFSWIQMVLDGFGILLHVVLLIWNLTSLNHCLETSLEGMRKLDPPNYYDELDTSNLINNYKCEEVSGGIISIGPITIFFHIMSLFLSSFLLIGAEQRNINNCVLWIRLAGILALLEFILLVSHIQILRTQIVLTGLIDCAYKICGIWLVHRFTGDVDGYLGTYSSATEESYNAIHSNSAEVLSAGPISLMDYHENLRKTGIGWT